MPTAIVTGASRGIGFATCKALLEAGWQVQGVDIASIPPKDMGPLLEFIGDKFMLMEIDISSPDAAERIVEKTLRKFGRVDALVNAAGIMDLLQSADTLDDGLWDRVIAINLTAPVRLMGAVIKAFNAQGGGGAIANVGSYASISGGAAGVAYTASKHGLVGATKSTAFRFKGEGIRCNIVLPGAVATGIMSGIDQTKMDMASAAVLGPVREAAHSENLRLQPEQVASMLVHLVSESSSGINGAAIPIDNGWSTI